MSVNNILILVADDDEEDRMLVEDALREARIVNDCAMVKDGVELIDFLRGEGSFAERKGKPLPGLILLDLNMPRMDGREALNIIKSDPELRSIPVVVLTTSKAEEDIFRTYNLGVNSFVTKPVSFDALVEIMRVLGRYWFQIVQLPGTPKN
jgi:CheY-like chemotaxis protein